MTRRPVTKYSKKVEQKPSRERRVNKAAEIISQVRRARVEKGRKEGANELRAIEADAEDAIIPEKSCIILFKPTADQRARLRNLSELTPDQLQLLARCVDHPHDHCGCPARSTASNCTRIAKHDITDPMAELLVPLTSRAGITFNKFVAGIHEDDAYVSLSDIETTFRELLEAAHPQIMGICDDVEGLKNINVKFVKHMTYAAINASTIAQIMMAGRGDAAKQQKEELRKIPAKCLTIVNDLDAANAAACKAVGEYIHSYFQDTPRADNTIYILNDGNAGVKNFMKYWSGAGKFMQSQTTQVYMDSATNSVLLDGAYVPLVAGETHTYNWFTFTEPIHGIRSARVADIVVSSENMDSNVGIRIKCTLNNLGGVVIEELISNYTYYTNGPTLDYIARLTDKIAEIPPRGSIDIAKLVKSASQRGVWPMKDLLLKFVKAYTDARKPLNIIKQDLIDFISDWKTYGDGEISRQARAREGRTLVISVDQNSSTCMRLLGQDGIYSHKNKHDMFRRMGTPVATAGERELMRLQFLLMVFQHYINILQAVVFAPTTHERIRTEMGKIATIINTPSMHSTLAATPAGIYATIMKLGDIYNYLNELHTSLETIHTIVTAAGGHYSELVIHMGEHTKFISSFILDARDSHNLHTLNLAAVRAKKFTFPGALMKLMTPLATDAAPFEASIIEFNDYFQAYLMAHVIENVALIQTTYDTVKSVGRVVRIFNEDKSRFYNAFNFSFDLPDVNNSFNYAPADFIHVDETYTLARTILLTADRRFSKTKFKFLAIEQQNLSTGETKYMPMYEFTDALKTIHESFKSADYKERTEKHFTDLYDKLNGAVVAEGSGEPLVAAVDTIFQEEIARIQRIFTETIIPTALNERMEGGAKLSAKDEERIRSGIVAALALLTEFQLGAAKMPLIDVQSVPIKDTTSKPRNNDDIFADPNYAKIIGARGPEIAEFADKFFRNYARIYRMHDLVNALDINALERLYIFSDNSGAASATPAQATPTEIESEIKSTEARLASLKSALANTRRRRSSSRSYRSTKPSFQPILSAIKEEYESPAESRSTQRSAGLWADVKSFLKKGVQLSQTEQKTLGTLLGMAEKAGDSSKDVLKVRTLAKTQGSRRPHSKRGSIRNRTVRGSRPIRIH